MITMRSTIPKITKSKQACNKGANIRLPPTNNTAQMYLKKLQRKWLESPEMNLIVESSQLSPGWTLLVQLQHVNFQYGSQYHLPHKIREHDYDDIKQIARDSRTREKNKDDLPIIAPCSWTITARSLNISFTSPICCWISWIPCSLSSIMASLKAISLSSSKTSCLQDRPFRNYISCILYIQEFNYYKPQVSKAPQY